MGKQSNIKEVAVMEKYNVSKEEIEKYNKLDNVILGTKIIVPLKNE